MVAAMTNGSGLLEYRGAVEAAASKTGRKARPGRQVREVLDTGAVRPRGRGRAVLKTKQRRGTRNDFVAAKLEGRADKVFVIAVERNGTGRYEFHRAVGTEVL